MKIEFICLANSWKKGGNCIAGWRTDGKGWIRPTSSLTDGALLSHECRYQGGEKIKLLDIVEVDVEPDPKAHQSENCVLNSINWEKVGHLNRAVAGQCLKNISVDASPLLDDTCNYVDYDQLIDGNMGESLALIEPESLRFYPKTWENKTKTRCDFNLTRGGASYENFSVTDPEFDKRFKESSTSWIDKNSRIFLTISRAGPMKEMGNRCYKLVAGVIVLPPD